MGRIIALATGLSVIAGLIGLAVWNDNRSGFRDAEAFAALLAAEFGMISAILLLAAILVQGLELSLQRQELRLQRIALEHQRAELARVANSGEHQTKIEEERRQHSTRDRAIASARSYISSNEQHIRNVVLNAALDTVRRHFARQSTTLLRLIIPVRLTFQEARFKRGQQVSPSSIILHARSAVYFGVAYKEVAFESLLSEVAESNILNPLVALHRSLENKETQDWFEGSLCVSLGRFPRLSYDETFILIRLASMRAKDSTPH